MRSTSVGGSAHDCCDAGFGPNFFSSISIHGSNSYRTRPEAFAFSVLGQAAVLAIIIYFTSCVIRTPPGLVHRVASLDLP